MKKTKIAKSPSSKRRKNAASIRNMMSGNLRIDIIPTLPRLQAAIDKISKVSGNASILTSEHRGYIYKSIRHVRRGDEYVQEHSWFCETHIRKPHRRIKIMHFSDKRMSAVYALRDAFIELYNLL